MACSTTLHDNNLFGCLSEIFPEACPNYLRNLCRDKIYTPQMLNFLISEVLEDNNYPKCRKMPSPEKAIDFQQQLEIMVQMLPNADPNYLKEQCRNLYNKPEELREFVLKLIESSQYPTKKDYLERQRRSSQVCFYTTQFDATEFLKIIPDPAAVFGAPNRKVNLNQSSYQYAYIFLSNSFRQLPVFTIRRRFTLKNFNIFATYLALEKIDPKVHLICKRKMVAIQGEIPQNIPLLQEIAFIKHREEIEAIVNAQKATKLEERRKAKEAGMLQTCSCCYDEEVMPTDIYECEKGCIFCKDCIQKGTEVAYGNGKLEFPCLNHCSSYFSLHTLQAILNPNMFSKIIQKKQLEEVKAAGMEDLEMCPFCNFAIILPKDEKLFHCLNPECMKETCRLCKEPSHLPLKCGEVEKAEDVKLRTYIENKMSEALFRTCYKCGMKFIKADGCNRMTCSCGAKMCYICGAAVKDYSHFNGPGGDRFDLCPLFNDTDKFHEAAVLRAAKVAKSEKGVDSGNSKLKIDPTADIEAHYEAIVNSNRKSVVPPPAALHFDPRVANIGVLIHQLDQLRNIQEALHRH